MPIPDTSPASVTRDADSLPGDGALASPAGRGGWAWDVVLAMALFVVALAVRLPNLHRMPRYTDEVKEVMWALRIYWGEHLPLAAHNGYGGAVWTYALAASFGLVGPSPTLPRTVAMLAGCLTVVAAYALGRSMGGRVAGFVAGTLMTTSFVPVYVNSHVAWSICVTPLLTTAALWAVHRGVRSGRGPLLAVSGLLVGLAMQTHPLAVLLVPPVVVWFVLQPEGRRMLGTPSPWMAVVLLVAGYANMIWFHASSRLETVTEALDKLSDGVPGAPTPASYAHVVEKLLFNLVDLLTAQGHHGTAAFRADPATFVRAASVALVLLLAYGALRKDALPLLVVVSTVVLMPLFNRDYGFPLGARYLSFLLPVVYGGVGLSAAALLDALTRRGPRARRVGVAAIGVAVLALALVQLVPLRRIYAAGEARGRTNDLVHEMAEGAHREHEAGAEILLSERIESKFSGGGHAHRVLATLLGLRDVRTTKVHKDLKGIDEQLAGCVAPDRRRDCVLVISARQADELGEDYPLARLPFSTMPDEDDGEDYGVYRVGD